MAERVCGGSVKLSPRTVLIVGAAVLVAGGVLAFVLKPSEDDLENAFAGGGALGPALYAALYATLIVAVVPALPLTLAAGALYGPVGGALVSVVGASAGATAAFAIARRSARGSVERVRGARLQALEERLSGKGFLALIVLRLIPVVPFSALNYAAGATSISGRDYVLATVFGIVPSAVAFASLGAGLDDPASPLFIGAAVVAIGLGLLAKAYSDRLALTESKAATEVVAPTPAGRAPIDRHVWRHLAWAAGFFGLTIALLIVATVAGLFH